MTLQLKVQRLLIHPYPLLRMTSKQGIQTPSPSLEEGFRVRATSRVTLGSISLLQMYSPHPPTPAARALRSTPKKGEGEPDLKSLSLLGRGI